MKTFTMGNGQFHSTSRAAVAIPDLKVTIIGHKRPVRVQCILDSKPINDVTYIFLSVNGKLIAQEPKEDVKIIFADRGSMQGWGFETIINVEEHANVLEVFATAGVYGQFRGMSVEEV